MEIPKFETVAGWIKGFLPMIKELYQMLLRPKIDTKVLGPIDQDFQLEVRNIGGGVAIPCVFLDDVTDDNDKTTGIVTSSVEIYRMDSLDPMRLFGRARSVFAFLSVDWMEAAGPCLRVNTVNTEMQSGKAIKSKGKMLITRPEPMEVQKGIHLIMRVVFYSTENPLSELTDKDFKYSVKPTSVPGQYKVSLVRERDLPRTV